MYPFRLEECIENKRCPYCYSRNIEYVDNRNRPTDNKHYYAIEILCWNCMHYYLST